MEQTDQEQPVKIRRIVDDSMNENSALNISREEEQRQLKLARDLDNLDFE